MQYFRLNKCAFKYLLDECINKMKPARRLSSIPLILRLSAFLRFLADGSYQLSTGQDFNINIAQPTVSVNLKTFLEFFEKEMCPIWISIFHRNYDADRNKQVVYSKFGIPGVVGCVDGTHIRIMKPKDNPHLFINRKGFYSLNCMIVTYLVLFQFKNLMYAFF